MKNFNLATNKFFRKFIGFLIVAIANYYVIESVDTNLKVLMFLFANAFGVYFIMEYSSFGTDEWVSLDFRDDNQKIEDEYNRKRNLLEAAKENLILQVATGELSKRSAEERLDALIMLEHKMYVEPVLLNQQNDYV